MPNPAEYKGYTIEDDGGFGFYRVRDLRGEQVATCEGFGTACDIVDEHIARVYRFYNINCDLSPLQLRAARKLNITQAEFIIEHGGESIAKMYEDTWGQPLPAHDLSAHCTCGVEFPGEAHEDWCDRR